jgi:hypothetical protein
VPRAALTSTPSLSINKSRRNRDQRTATLVLLLIGHDPASQQIHETGPRRIPVLPGSEACLVGVISHVTHDTQLRTVQHLRHQRTQEEVKHYYLSWKKAQACVEYPLSESRRTRGEEGCSPIQDKPITSYTIVHRTVPKQNSHRHSSKDRRAYREPSKDRPSSAVEQASGRFKGTLIGTSGGPDIQPADLPKRISVPRRYDRDPNWQGFMKLTENQRPDRVEVINKPLPRRPR